MSKQLPAHNIHGGGDVEIALYAEYAVRHCDRPRCLGCMLLQQPLCGKLWPR